MPVRRLIDSFNYAIRGTLFCLKTQHNMRIHFFIGILITLLAILTHVEGLQFSVLLLTISMVIVTEMINTAIEKTIDMVTNERHPIAEIAKDVSAAAVLFSSLCAVAVGYLVFYPKLTDFSSASKESIANLSLHATFASLGIVAAGVIAIKAFVRKGSFVRGGFPSGHSALSFSIATAIGLISPNPIVIGLGSLLALLVAQSRLESRTHTLYEIIAGALLGICITLSIFKISQVVLG